MTMTKCSRALHRPNIGFRRTFLQCLYRHVVPAAILTGVVTGGDFANAANLTWNNLNADWTIGTNWTPGGPPGVGDVAIVNAGNPQLNVNATLLGLIQGGGTISGTGLLQLTGASTWTAGTHFGTGISQFDGNLGISGVNAKVISGGRTVRLNGTTTWSGNTGNNNTITMGGASFLNNAGTFIVMVLLLPVLPLQVVVPFRRTVRPPEMTLAFTPLMPRLPSNWEIPVPKWVPAVQVEAPVS